MSSVKGEVEEGRVKGAHLDILDLWLVGIRALRRPNVIVLGMSLSLEPSEGPTLGLLNVNCE